MMALLILFHGVGIGTTLCIVRDFPRKLQRGAILRGLRRKDFSALSVITKFYVVNTIIYLGYLIWRLLTW